MENFIKSFLISLLMSGSFMTHAAEQQDHAPWEAISAARREMSLEEYRYIRPFLEGAQKNELEQQEVADRKEWEEAQSLAWIRENAQEQLPARETKKPEENEYQKMLALRAEQTARRLEAEERAQKEEASAALSRKMQLQNEEEQRRRQEQVRRKPEPIEIATFISQVNAYSEFYASGAKRPVLEKFMRIFSDLTEFARAIQNGNVHNVDGYVATNTVPLLEVGRLFDLDDPKLPLEEVGKQMKDFMGQLPEFFGNYKYAKGSPVEKPVTAARIKEVLDLHFKGLKVPGNVQETWSRAWTLAYKLYTEYRSTEYIQIIFDEAIEGHETEINGQPGGCVQGRIDRALIAYATLLGKAGVKL